MAKIEKTVENERMITATFTQSEWNELFAGLGSTSSNTRKEILEFNGLRSRIEDSFYLYEFIEPGRKTPGFSHGDISPGSIKTRFHCVE